MRPFLPLLALLVLVTASPARPPFKPKSGLFGEIEAEIHWGRLAIERMAKRPPVDWLRLWWAAMDWLKASRLHDRNPARAVPILKELAAAVAKMLGEDHLYTGNALNMAGLTSTMRGDLAGALPLSKRALASYKASLGEGSWQALQAANNLGLLYLELNDYRSAKPLFEQAAAGSLKLEGESSLVYHSALNNLALAQFRTGDFVEAFANFKHVLALRKRHLGADHPLYATTLNNYAFIQGLVGGPRAALPAQKEALAIRKKALGTKHPDYAASLNNLACLQLDAGDHDAAARAFHEVLGIIRETMGLGQLRYAYTLYNLARLHSQRRRPSAALLCIEQSLAVSRRSLQLAAELASERQQLGIASKLPEHLDLRLTLPDDEPAASHRHILEWKGVVFAIQQRRRLFARLSGDSAGGEARKLAQALQGLAQGIAEAGATGGQAGLERLRKLSMEKDEKEQRLAELSRDYRLGLRPPSPAQLAASLPEGVVLVDFLFHDRNDGQRELSVVDPEAPPRKRLTAWILRAGSPIVRVGLGPAGPVEEAVEAWRAAIARGRTDERSPARLRELVWHPLVRHLGKAETVLVAPDGVLARLPFAALPGSKKGTHLLEETPIAVFPLPRLLARLLAEAAPLPPSLLVAGDVDFGKGKGRERWQALPATRPEADGLAAAFRAAFRRDAAVLAGSEAGKAALAGLLPRHRFAHLATHGFFAKADPDALDGESPGGWHPGLRSGLVLAGANDPARASGSVLTALEVAEMDLSGMELAVLSACETGLGKEAGGEGILGLQRAFQLAGCRSVVSSLWSVEDAATSVLMERFYHHLWKGKKGKLAALRQAQLDILRDPGLVEKAGERLVAAVGKERAGQLRGLGDAVKAGALAGKRSPVAWWAAFVLSGDWR